MTARSINPNYASDAETFFRQITWPQEEQARWTSARWNGCYRWFLAANVIPLEKYRTPAEWARICAILLCNH